MKLNYAFNDLINAQLGLEGIKSLTPADSKYAFD